MVNREMRDRSLRPQYHYVYALRCGDVVKIGVTSCLRERTDKIASSMKKELTLDAYLMMPYGEGHRVERFIHRELDAYHVGSEWFLVSAPQRLEAFRRARKQFPWALAGTRWVRATFPRKHTAPKIPTKRYVFV